MTTPELVLDMGKPVNFNVVRIREYLPLGQRVDSFAVDTWQNGRWQQLAAATGLRLVRSQSEVDLAPDLVVGLPVEWARSRRLLPVRVDGRVCFLAADPSDMDSIEYLALLVGEHAEPLLAAPDLVSACMQASAAVHTPPPPLP